MTKRQVHLTFAAVLAAMFLAGLDGAIVATALPQIVGDLHGFDQISWVVTAYLLASTVTIPLYGKLSDLYGRRRVFVVAILIFLLGSALCGTATTMTQLIAFRGVQGVGAGGIIPLAIAVIGDLFAPRERGRYQAYTGAVFGATSVAGPLVGGLITDHASWRWVFYVNLPVGAVALAMILTNMHLPRPSRRPRIDYAGMATLGGATTLILLMGVWGWPAALAGGALALVFVAIELRAPEPLLPLRLFRNPIFSVVMLAGPIAGASMFVISVYIPVFVQQVQGATATSSGAVLIPYMLGFVASGIVAGQIVTRTGRYKALPVIGSTMLAVGFWLCSRMDATTSRSHTVAVMVLVGLAMGNIFQTYTVAVQNSVAPGEIGTATAATQFFRSIGCTLGLAAFGAVLTHRLTSELAARLPAGTVDAKRLLEPRPPRLAPETLAAARDGLAAALSHAFLWSVPALVLAVVCALLLKEVPLRTVAPHASRGGDDDLPAVAPAD